MCIRDRFAAPGQDMDVTKQNPPSDLIIYIKRANIIDDKELNVIPNPVFEPSHEENIKSSKTTTIYNMSFNPWW